MQTNTNTPITPTISEYKGNPMITLNPGDRFPFSFGLGKAKQILAHLEEIKAFVESNGKNAVA